MYLDPDHLHVNVGINRLLVNWAGDQKKNSRITAKIGVGKMGRAGPFQKPKLTSIIYQLLQSIHKKVRE